MPFLQFDAAKLKLLFWLSHSLCAVAFTPPINSFGTDGEEMHVIGCPQRAMAIVALQSSPLPDLVGDEVKEDPKEGAQHIHYSKQIIVPVDDLTTPRSPPCAFSNASSFRSLKSQKDSDRSPSKLMRDDVANKSGSKLSLPGDQNSPYSEGNNLSRNDSNSCNHNTDKENENYSKESLVQSSSNVYYNRGGGSVCSSVGPSSNNTMGTALTSVTGAAHRLKIDRATRLPKYFDFNIIELSLLRNINRRVDLNEMVSLEYVTDGSHSQVYSAVWNNQQVIVKVIHVVFY